MKTLVTLLVAAVLYAMLPGIARGNCQIQTSSYYSVSVSEAESGNPFGSTPPITTPPLQAHLLVSVVVDGSSSMQMIAVGGCPDAIISAFNANKQNITHSPSVLNKIGSVGGWSAGPSVCAECYLSYQTNSDSGLLNVGQEVTISYSGTVTCAVAGSIFDDLSNLIAGEIAYTRSVNTGRKVATFYVNGVPWNSWLILSYCNPLTSPPDWNPLVYNALAIFPPSSNFYIDGIAACARINVTGAPWFCSPGGSIAWPQSFNLGPAACTHNP